MWSTTSCMISETGGSEGPVRLPRAHTASTSAPRSGTGSTKFIGPGRPRACPPPRGGHPRGRTEAGARPDEEALPWCGGQKGSNEPAQVAARGLRSLPQPPPQQPSCTDEAAARERRRSPSDVVENASGHWVVHPDPRLVHEPAGPARPRLAPRLRRGDQRRPGGRVVASDLTRCQRLRGLSAVRLGPARRHRPA
jgi:hypothetical protein